MMTHGRREREKIVPNNTTVCYHFAHINKQTIGKRKQPKPKIEA
jgi:hypothetical protein